MRWAYRHAGSSRLVVQSCHGTLYPRLRAQTRAQVRALARERLRQWVRVQLRAGVCNRARRLHRYPPPHRRCHSNRLIPRAITARSSLGYPAAPSSRSLRRPPPTCVVARAQRRACAAEACVRPSRCCPCPGHTWRSCARSRLNRSAARRVARRRCPSVRRRDMGSRRPHLQSRRRKRPPNGEK